MTDRIRKEQSSRERLLVAEIVFQEYVSRDRRTWQRKTRTMRIVGVLLCSRACSVADMSH